MKREDVYSALFTIISAAALAAGAKTTSRKLRHWSDVSAAEQPAVFQVQRTENSDQRPGIPGKWTMNLDIFLYVNTSDDPNAAPTTILNPIVDAIVNCLPSADPGGPVTLGTNRVSHAWVSGPIETSEGVLGNQEVAIIPVEIVGAE